MRGRDAIGVAVRGPEGQIFAAQEPLNSILHRNRFARAPFFRGIVVLYETLVIGTRWLMRSGSLAAAGDGVTMGRGTLAVTFATTIAIAVALFVLLPLFLAQTATNAAIPGGQVLVQHLVEGVIRVLIFVAYLLVVGRSSEVRRVFQYHGAEHMTIHALEHDDPLTIERIRRYPTAHPRCGTEFLVVFIIVSILLFSLLAGMALWIAIVGRILLIPVVAAVSYEILRWGARHRQNWAVRWLFLPGHLAPVDHHEAAGRLDDRGRHRLHARALAADGEPAPEGSLAPPTEPIPDAKTLAADVEARTATPAPASEATGGPDTDLT